TRPDVRLLDQRVPGQAGDALADLVALDLRGAAGDRHAAVHKHEHVAHPGDAVHEGGLGAEQLGADGDRLVADLGDDQLGHGALGAGTAALHGAVGAAQVEQAHGLDVGEVAAHAPGAALEAVGVGVELLDDDVGGQEEPAASAAADAHALVAEGGAGDGPAAVDRADHVVVG